MDEIMVYLVVFFIVGGMLFGSKLLDIFDIMADFIELICRMINDFTDKGRNDRK